MKRYLNFFLFIFSITEIILSSVAFFQIAWGTGEWLGDFSFKWAVLFLLFVLFCLFLLVSLAYLIWSPHVFAPFFSRLIRLRRKVGRFGYGLAFLVLCFPVWFLQYTSWGVVFYSPYLRILLWLLTLVLLGFLLTPKEEKVIGWTGFLAGLLLTSSAFVLSGPLKQVTSYPFSLGWSEGNRLWDYSILFGRSLYRYPAGKTIPVYLDIGRQFVGGLPFLLPKVSILGERLWVALTNVIPYLLLGWVSFRAPKSKLFLSFLAGLFAYIFVYQGPVHTPLVLCAILIALAWQRSFWVSIPLILVSSYFAQASRFTWVLAPAMWIVMLEFAGVANENCQLFQKDWFRAFLVGVTGVFGGLVAPFVFNVLKTHVDFLQTIAVEGGGGGISLSVVQNTVTSQPLLWYRLFPNATYGMGILLALLLAVGPLITVLLYLASTGRWQLSFWQKLSVLLPLAAFLMVGLVASTKIGGGGDLHNLDMFIIGVMFTAAVAWKNGGREWVQHVGLAPDWIKIVLILMLVIPAYGSLQAMRPISFADDLSWVMTLTDTIPASPPETLPAKQDVNNYLDIIQKEVRLASSRGDVLFMDQRQLLTFGYVDVPLIPEYDKKVLIDKAMANDATYFDAFYKDITSQRFSLIITSPLRTPVQDSSYQFGEENNAWVKWVSQPILCYYEQDKFFKSIGIQLLIPKKNVDNCPLPTNNALEP
jgi:hypothetical protein